MLKNISDYLSLFTLIVLSISALRFFIASISPNENKFDNSLSKKQLFKDYLNNVDE